MAKIGIAHYHIGKTDGVSLEIEKRKKVLEKLGHEVILISGPNQVGADHVIEELGFAKPEIEKINRNGLNHLSEYSNPDEFIKEFTQLSHNIQQKLTYILSDENLDLVFVHNILSLGRHPTSSVAMLNTLDEFQIPTIAIHHDIYWERVELLKVENDFIHNIFNKYLIPDRDYIQHVVINSIAQNNVKHKRNITAEIQPDFFDFDQSQWVIDEYNQDLRKVLEIPQDNFLVLQATRIVPRKGIEIAIDFCTELQNNIDQDISLLLGNYIDLVEPEAHKYAEKLKNKAKGQNLNLVFAGSNVGYERSNGKDQKQFSLWDTYAHTDLITYPSLVEGWGNQFLEAVFAQKPVVVFEYPVFETDIEPEGYRVISLGNQTNSYSDNGLVQIDPVVIQNAVKQTIKLLNNPDQMQKIAQHNLDIAQQNHSLEILEQHLNTSINKLLNS